MRKCSKITSRSYLLKDSWPSSPVRTRSLKKCETASYKMTYNGVGSEPLLVFLLEGLACTVRSCMCGRTCCNSTSIQDAVLKSLHLTHPGSWGMITLGQYSFWPHLHREILNKAAQCKPCTDIGKNIRPVVPASKWKPLLNCSERNEEIQIDFGGPITNEKDHDIHFLACIDHFSKYPTVEVVDKANGPNVIKFLDEYIQIHGVPQNIM